MTTITVTGADGNAKIKNSSVTGIQNSNGKLPPQEDIRKMEVTGVKGNAEVENSVVAGINNGQMGSIENRQQTYNIGNAHGVVGGQDMRGASVDQGGITGQNSGPIGYFKGKDYKMSKYDITIKGGEGTTNNMAGVVYDGMGNTYTTNHNQENRQQTYNIGNAQSVVGGQDMRGATVDQRGITGQSSGPKTYFKGKALSDISEVDIVGLLREKKLEKHIQLFKTHGIDGDLLSQLNEDELRDFGIEDSFERKKILNLKKFLPK